MASDPAFLNGTRRGIQSVALEPWFFLISLWSLFSAISYEMPSVLRTRFDETVLNIMVVVQFAAFVVGAASRIEKALRRERSH